MLEMKKNCDFHLVFICFLTNIEYTNKGMFSASIETKEIAKDKV